MTVNVAHGRGDGRKQYFLDRDQIKANLEKIALTLNAFSPDLVALQEIDRASRWSGRFDHLQYLKQQSSMQNAFHGIHASGKFFHFGTAFLSTQPLGKTHSVRFSRSFPSLRKGFVAAQFEWTFNPDAPPVHVNVISVHFDFLRNAVRKRQAETLVNFVQSLGGPVVLLGDFNSVWAADKSIVRSVAKTLDLQAFEPESDKLATYRARNTRVDWILISKPLKFVRYVNVPAILSDHDAVIADLEYIKNSDECLPLDPP